MADKKPPGPKKPTPTKPYPGLVNVAKKSKLPQRESPGTLQESEKRPSEKPPKKKS